MEHTPNIGNLSLRFLYSSAAADLEQAVQFAESREIARSILDDYYQAIEDLEVWNIDTYNGEDDILDIIESQPAAKELSMLMRKLLVSLSEACNAHALDGDSVNDHFGYVEVLAT